MINPDSAILNHRTAEFTLQLLLSSTILVLEDLACTFTGMNSLTGVT